MALADPGANSSKPTPPKSKVSPGAVNSTPAPRTLESPPPGVSAGETGAGALVSPPEGNWTYYSRDTAQAEWDAWVESVGGESNIEVTRSKTGIPTVKVRTWVPDDSSSGSSSSISKFGSPSSGDSEGGEWKWVKDGNATSLLTQLTFADDDEWLQTGYASGSGSGGGGGGGRGSGSGSGRAYVEADPTKVAQKAFSDFLSRAKGVYDLQDQENDWVREGNRYNMAMAQDFRDVGGFGFSDLYVGRPPAGNLSNMFEPYVDDGINDPEFLQLSERYGMPIKGFAMGTINPVAPDPMFGVPEKLRPLIGKGSTYVGPPEIPGIPTGQKEPDGRKAQA